MYGVKMMATTVPGGSEFNESAVPVQLVWLRGCWALDSGYRVYSGNGLRRMEDTSMSWETVAPWIEVGGYAIAAYFVFVAVVFAVMAVFVGRVIYKVWKEIWKDIL
jgi:hypothetical protein